MLTLLIAACTSVPQQPAAIARYDRDMRKAAEYLQDGRLRDAATRYRLAAERALQFDDSARIAQAKLGLGAVSIELHELEQATSHYREAAAESRHARRSDLSARATLGIAEAARREGDCDAALIEAAPLRQSNDRSLRLGAELLTVNCLRAMGDATDATSLLDRLAKEIASAPDALRSAWHAARAADRLAAGDLDAALADAEEALSIDRERRYPPAIAADHRLLAEIHAAANRDADALLHRRRAERISILSGLSITPNHERH